ncbi:hypothetical protein MAB47J26_08877 [Mycobacteroides abscessus 47J26]|nr:hypothetical protein MAB47J26_08877 [Mycobacteroides abscessus 47J26]
MMFALLIAICAIVFLAVILGGLGLGGWAMWECWKTAHRPGYQSPLVHGWED